MAMGTPLLGSVARKMDGRGLRGWTAASQLFDAESRTNGSRPPGRSCLSLGPLPPAQDKVRGEVSRGRRHMCPLRSAAKLCARLLAPSPLPSPHPASPRSFKLGSEAPATPPHPPATPKSGSGLLHTRPPPTRSPPSKSPSLAPTMAGSSRCRGLTGVPQIPMSKS